MHTFERLVKDPVCGMMVAGEEYNAAYADGRYEFCSFQCMERFLDRPGLYVGLSGRPAPSRKSGRLRRRRMTLSSSLASERAGEVAAGLRSMMGVKTVILSGRMDGRDVSTQRTQDGGTETALIDSVDVAYDLFQATAEQLERKLAEFDVGLDYGTAGQLKRDFVRYLEICELDDLEADTSRNRY